ncbi:hypothetical protein APHAL10511_005043 [Amanita phalloides]|nr:hypothetical protein APHAL10511_005043 [Amanita phalloides]
MQKEEQGTNEGNIGTEKSPAVGSSMLSNSTGIAISRSILNSTAGNMLAITINLMEGAMPMGDISSTVTGKILSRTTDADTTCDDQGSLRASKRRRSADHQAHHGRTAQVATSATSIEDFNAVSSNEEPSLKRCKTVVQHVSQDMIENVVRGVGPADSESWSSSAKRYMRLQQCHQLGHPLYLPGPNLSLSLSYRKKGIRVGDVGRITRDGAFDFLFNACLPADHPANPSVLPDGYQPIENVELLKLPLYDPTSNLMSDGIKHISAIPETFHCKASEGAILVLPDGATLYEAVNPDLFGEFARRHAGQLYSFFNHRRGSESLNGSFYIVTACIKSESWGIATFDRQSQSCDSLEFMAISVPPNHPECMSKKSGRRYEWKQVGAAIARAGPRLNGIVATDGEEMLNQCTFMRGYVITLPDKTSEQLVEPVHAPATGSTGLQEYSPALGGYQNSGTSQQAAHGGWNVQSSDDGMKHVKIKDDYVSDAIHAIHPSTYINHMLLQMVPHAKVAISHDDDWCNIQPEDFKPNLPFNSVISATNFLKKIFTSYDIMVDEHSAAFLVDKAVSQEHVLSPSMPLMR